MEVTVCNPLLRTPLSLIVDDSCPVINLTHFWIKQRHEWKARHKPGVPPERWEGDFEKVRDFPTIPSSFVMRWGEWCEEQGIKGKFSFIPFPAGVGRVDIGFPDFPRAEFEAWLRAVRELIEPNFDLTPEMITHTHVLDLRTWRLTEEWEQVEWADPPLELLTDYIAKAMELLQNAGFRSPGVTSPGGFGRMKEDAYARAVLDASLAIGEERRPFYFLHVETEGWPEIRILHADKERGTAVASIVGCTGDWFGGWTGYDRGDPDLFITPDLKGGRIPKVLEKELPCILVGHWPGFYFNGEEFGFHVLSEVKRRLSLYDPDGTRTIWMKTSEIGHYWMARTLSDISAEEVEGRKARIVIKTHFPARNFTLSLDKTARRVLLNGKEVDKSRSRRDFRSGTFLVEGERTYIGFDLEEGRSEILCELG
jgi:hypothetical protein